VKLVPLLVLKRAAGGDEAIPNFSVFHDNLITRLKRSADPARL